MDSGEPCHDEETLAVLASEALRKDLHDAAEAEAAGDVTSQEEMATLMVERLHLSSQV